MNADEIATETRLLLVEANEWIQARVAREGGIIGCRQGNLCLACRLSSFVRDTLKPPAETETTDGQATIQDD